MFTNGLSGNGDWMLLLCFFLLGVGIQDPFRDHRTYYYISQEVHGPLKVEISVEYRIECDDSITHTLTLIRNVTFNNYFFPLRGIVGL